MVKLFKSLYTFKAAYKSTLSFSEEEVFVDLSVTGAEEDRNWYYVVNSAGQAGYVPRNYVSTVSLGSAAVSELVSRALSRLSHNNQLSAEDKNEAVQKLEELKQSLSKSSLFQPNFHAAGPITSEASVTLGQITTSAPRSRAFTIPHAPKYTLAVMISHPDELIGTCLSR